MSDSTVISIDVNHRETFEKIVNDVQKKAKKLKFPEPVFEYGEIKRVEKSEFNSIGLVIRSWVVYKQSVTLRNIDCKLEGWEYVASKDADGVVLGYTRKRDSIPFKFLEHNTTCDHCNTKRKRNLTFIVYNEETDTWMQVGSTCIDDFIKGHSVTMSFGSFLNSLSSLGSIDDDYLESVGVSTPTETYKLETIATMAAFIDYLGFKPSSFEADSTKSHVINTLLKRNSYGEKVPDIIKHISDIRNTTPYEDFAVGCIEWFRNGFTGNSFFQQNLRNAMTSESPFISVRNYGMVCYGVSLYYDLINKKEEVEQTRKESVHLGVKLKTRLKDIELEVFETYENVVDDTYSWDGGYITLTSIYAYDKDDNVIMFESSNGSFIDITKGEKIKISGTLIHQAKRKNGVKYNKLNRVILR